MSTKTTFKRIALVAVAALGLGVLSVAPSSAAASGVAITGVTNGATTLRSGSTTTVDSDTTTAATFTVSGLFTDLSDTATVQVFEKSRPTAATTANTVRIAVADTSTAVTAVTSGGTAMKNWYRSGFANADTITAGGSFKINASTAGNVGATFGIYLDTHTAAAAGAYVYSIAVTTSSTNGAGSISVTTATSDITITVSAGAAATTVASATYSTLGAISATTGLATASATARATLLVTLKNASNNAAAESVTATITGPGTIGVAGGAVGKSVVLQYTGATTLSVYSDGTAGTSTIQVSTPSVTFAPASISFYSAVASTSVASTAKSVIEASNTSTSDTVRATIKDSLGNLWTGDAYIYATSAASALIAGSETPVLCTFDTGTDQRHECPVTGKLVGTAKFKVIDAATVALATLTSNEVDVRVAVATPASFSLVFDKASYAPGEKARLSVVVLDANGAQIVGKTYADILASGGITPSVALSAGSDTLTSTSAVISATSSSTSGTTAGQQNYVVYMPYATGDITVTATGGTGLPLAARVVKTATASVVNSSVDAATDAANEATDAANAATDAALAAADAADAATAAAQDASDAVAALSATVAKLVASLKAQITSLTNLVIKIQKKVKA